MKRIWLLISAVMAATYAVLGCDLPAADMEPEPRPAAAPSTPAGD